MADRLGRNPHAVLFKVEGTKVVIFTDEEDEDFLHMGLAIDLNDEMEIAWALDKANSLNDDRKAIKVTVHPEDRTVRFRIEAFLPARPSLPMIQRSVGAITGAVEEFFSSATPQKQLDA